MMLDRLAHELIALLMGFVFVVLDVLNGIEGAVAGALMRAGLPASLQTVVFIVVAVLFLVAVFRVFGGLIRAGLIVLLVLFLVQIIMRPHALHVLPEHDTGAPAQL